MTENFLNPDCPLFFCVAFSVGTCSCALGGGFSEAIVVWRQLKHLFDNPTLTFFRAQIGFDKGGTTNFHMSHFGTSLTRLREEIQHSWGSNTFVLVDHLT